MHAPLKYCVKEIVTFESAINRLALSLLIECPSVGECPVGGGGGGWWEGLLLCRDGQNTSRNPYSISNQNMIFFLP